MRRKSDHKGLFGGLTFSSALILFGVLLASGALVGLVVSQGLSGKRVAQTKTELPIRAVHIKPDLTQVKKQSTTPREQKQVMMTPAMLRQVSILEERIASLEGQIRSLSKSNLDLAEKVDTRGLDVRLQALEDSLNTFTASIDKRIKQTARLQQEKPQNLPRMTELTNGERKLLPPPFKTDKPEDISVKKEKPKVIPAPQKEIIKTQKETPQKPEPVEEPTEKIAMVPPKDTVEEPVEKPAKKEEPIKKDPVVQKTALPKHQFALLDLSKPEAAPEDDASGKTGWEPVVTYHNLPKKTQIASIKRKPRFTTERASRVITGSIKKPVQKRAPAVKKKPVASKPFAVHIASASNLYRIKDAWLSLQRDNGILRGLKPHIVSAGSEKKGAVPWKLLAGPLANEDQAARVCSRLNAKGNFCRRTTLGGHLLKF